VKIGNGTTDFRIIGTLDTDNNTTNTKFFINGNTCTFVGAAGSMQHFATRTGGHIFDNNRERMRLSNYGNLTVTGTISANGDKSIFPNLLNQYK
jgi:hypothetical protein